jgi:hypothetical protein
VIASSVALLGERLARVLEQLGDVERLQCTPSGPFDRPRS